MHRRRLLPDRHGGQARATFDHVYAGGDIEHLRVELAQTGAMAIRALLHLSGDQ